MNEKFSLQDEQYLFPYHYLTELVNEIPTMNKELPWGIDYLTYMDFIMDRINKLKVDNILDIGCGDGYLLNHLKNFKSKKGIDLSNKAIRFAKAFATDNVIFEEENIFNIQDKYSLVTLIEVLEHLPNNLIPSFIDKIEEIVENNGYFIISVPTTVIDVNEKHYRHYDETLLDKHLPFKKLKLKEEFRVYNETIFLKNFRRLLMNRFYYIKSKTIWNLLWKWHKKHTYNATRMNGAHLIRIYQKC